jgi:transketolase
VAVEAAHPEYWRRYVGLDGEVVGINRFGVSAPGALAMSTLGITAEAVASAVRKTVDEVKRRCP